jgi:hypothetical protein
VEFLYHGIAAQFSLVYQRLPNSFLHIFFMYNLNTSNTDVLLFFYLCLGAEYNMKLPSSSDGILLIGNNEAWKGTPLCFLVLGINP